MRNFIAEGGPRFCPDKGPGAKRGPTGPALHQARAKMEERRGGELIRGELRSAMKVREPAPSHVDVALIVASTQRASSRGLQHPERDGSRQVCPTNLSGDELVRLTQTLSDLRKLCPVRFGPGRDQVPTQMMVSATSFTYMCLRIHSKSRHTHGTPFLVKSDVKELTCSLPSSRFAVSTLETNSKPGSGTQISSTKLVLLLTSYYLM